MGLRIILTIIIALTVIFILRLIYRNRMESKAVKMLTDQLFPSGELQKELVIDEIMEMTKNRFPREDVLDYYLKIKGLHVLDLHTGVEANIREYLMCPTKIRLNYMELVRFYDKYLSFPEARGQKAVE